MDIIIIIIIAIGLSMDTLAVSISNGISIKNINFRMALIIAFVLATFQGIMPVIGWLFGLGVEKYIKEIDHWIAFILLGIIGFKMIFDNSFRSDKAEEFDISFSKLTAQAIATSIDALIIGVSLALLGWGIAFPAIIIFLTTLLFSLIGSRVGKELGTVFGKYATIVGGIVLIGIGLKILIEHIYY